MSVLSMLRLTCACVVGVGVVDVVRAFVGNVFIVGAVVDVDVVALFMSLLACVVGVIILVVDVDVVVVAGFVAIADVAVEVDVVVDVVCCC